MLGSTSTADLTPQKTNLKPGKKNIIICCDGTGNEFGSSNSNVVKLYTALKIDNEQVGYYHPGVGTMGDPGARGRVSAFWSQVKGLAFGAGFQANVLDAYRFLMEHYNQGDQVMFFGFSRGAYTARALAGLLDGYGLLCRGNDGHIPYAWRLYLAQLKDRSRHSIDEGEASAAAFKETFSHPSFRIHFVGLWDTVSSVGWVSAPLRLYNVAVNRTIDIVRHAVSIDERRCFYRDNLYGETMGQDIQQIWFAGVHSDVGGSYPQATSGLANITLEWMLDEARKAGVLFVPERREMVLGRGEPVATYPATQQLYSQPAARHVHVSLRGLWWILEILPHRYYDKDDAEELREVPLGRRRELPCGATVHHTVYERLRNEQCEYKPRNILPEDLTPLPTPLLGRKPVFYCYQPSRNLKDGTFKRRLILTVFVAAEGAAALLAIGMPLMLIGRSVRRYSIARRAPEKVRSVTAYAARSAPDIAK